MDRFEKAIAIAATAHAEVRDKAGGPYILHPLRMTFPFNTEEERIVTVLPDVVDDTDWTLKDLRAVGFAEIIIAGCRLRDISQRREMY